MIRFALRDSMGQYYQGRYRTGQEPKMMNKIQLANALHYRGRDWDIEVFELTSISSMPASEYETRIK